MPFLHKRLYFCDFTIETGRHFSDDFKTILDEEFSDGMFEGLKDRVSENFTKQKNYDLFTDYMWHIKKSQDRLRFDFDDIISLVVEAFKTMNFFFVNIRKNFTIFGG